MPSSPDWDSAAARRWSSVQSASAASAASPLPASSRRRQASAALTPRASASVTTVSGQNWTSIPIEPARVIDPAAGFALAGDEAQKRGLARAVAADQADALSPEGEAQMVKKDAAIGRCGRNGIECEEGRHEDTEA